jgi:hypothetical protein
MGPRRACDADAHGVAVATGCSGTGGAAIATAGRGGGGGDGSSCGQSTRAVVPPLQGAFCASYLYTTKGSQGFPKVAAQGHACRCAAGEGFTGHVRSGWSERESFDDEESSVY